MTATGRLDAPLHFYNIGNMEKKSALAGLAALAQETRLDIFRLLVERGPAGLAAGDIAQATGWPIETAMLSQVLSFMVILVPFQIAPVLTAMLLGNVAYGRMVRFCLAYTAIYLFVIAPLNFLWWRHLGMFG